MSCHPLSCAFESGGFVFQAAFPIRKGSLKSKTAR